jgi:dihydropyrimidinase
MADYDLLILNGIVVTDTETGEKDIAIKNEKIVKVVPRGSLSEATAVRTIDAKGGYVMVSSH